MQVDASTVCHTKVGSYSVCNYVLLGSNGNCCTMADVATALSLS